MVPPFTRSVLEQTASSTDSNPAKTSCPPLDVETTSDSRAVFRLLLGPEVVPQLPVLVTTRPPVAGLAIHPMSVVTKDSLAMVVKKDKIGY